jgi:MinD-like ATPase involved in chromosome partitioning or flagellar assembly
MERAVQVCVNRGEAVVLAEPRSDFAKAIGALAKQVAPSTPQPKKKVERKRMLSFAKA